MIVCDDGRMHVSEARQELQQKFNEICLEFDSGPPLRLMHYTTPIGFKGIVESGQLWDAGYGGSVPILDSISG
jgi:hypothetical protein